MAVERVEKRLRTVAAALDDAGIPYAVVGGNAVAAWIGRVDRAATRATKDVDLLVRRSDLERRTQALAARGFRREDIRSRTLFVDPAEPSRRSGVHLVWAGERVRPSYGWPAPLVEEAVRDPEGFLVLDLPALVRMKLTSLRLIDQVHIVDMLAVGLIDDAVRAALPEALRERLVQVEQSADEDA
ncbi:MAG: nucleotidyltransferase family protein [Phycisphaerales bacterium]|nr:nucleotidyltransferase family protein [Phycisphaerales bacterium]